MIIHTFCQSSSHHWPAALQSVSRSLNFNRTSVFAESQFVNAILGALVFKKTVYKGNRQHTILFIYKQFGPLNTKNI